MRCCLIHKNENNMIHLIRLEEDLGKDKDKVGGIKEEANSSMGEILSKTLLIFSNNQDLVLMVLEEDLEDNRNNTTETSSNKST